MLTLLYYCLKVIVCSGLLYGYYLLALRNNRFHHWNRYYLLAIIVVSFTLPLLQIPLPFFEEDEQPVVQSLRVIAAPDIYFSTLQPAAFVINWPMIAGILYGCIVLVLVLLFIRNIRSVLNLKKHYREENLNGIYFYNTTEPATPFSFFNNIFWNSSISLNNEKGQQMLRHELTHVQENHSVDKVAMELLIAVAWWNPFLFYIRKELSVIHEFIADKKASSGNDNLQYASLLLMKALGSQQYALGNPFFHSQLKRRLKMLTTNKNPRFSYLRRLLVLPLAAFSLILFSFKYKEAKDEKKAALPTYAKTAGEDEFDSDTAKPKLYVQIDKTYKGAAIESIMPTADMSGAIIKTVDDKTYFVDRTAAERDFNFIITDSGFIAPPGAVLVTGTNKAIARNGAFIQTPAYSNSPQYQYTVDTTAYGLSKVTNPHFVTGKEISINNQNQDMRVIDGSVNLRIEDVPKDLQKALIIVDGVKIEFSKLKVLDVKSFKSMDVLKGESAIAKYGDEGKNGVVEIKTKELLPEDALYIVDGKKVSLKEAETLFLSRKDNINWYVEVIDGAQALPTYGEAGKNGVVIINTKLAKNEVTMSEAGPNNSLTEKVVIGHRIGTDNSAFPEAGPDNLLVEKVVKGYRIRSDSSAVKSQASRTLAKQLDNLGEVVVVGYGQKKYDAVYTKVEEPASFPGGLEGWRRHLERNLNYPEAAQKHNTKGTVRVKMTVDKGGNLYDIKALNDPGNGLAAEAERVIQKGPKWIPAKQNGEVVDYSFIQTITFQLQ